MEARVKIVRNEPAARLRHVAAKTRPTLQEAIMWSGTRAKKDAKEKHFRAGGYRKGPRGGKVADPRPVPGILTRRTYNFQRNVVWEMADDLSGFLFVRSGASSGSTDPAEYSAYLAGRGHGDAWNPLKRGWASARRASSKQFEQKLHNLLFGPVPKVGT